MLESSNVAARNRSIVTVLSRSLKLRCPACGQSSILAGAFQVKHHCPNCRSLFKREEGFFVGAILANVMATEFVILVLCLVWLIVIGSSYETVLVGLFIVALLFPVAFYHHSWSLWLGFDYLIEGLPRHEKKTSSDRR
ncbi:MAG: DUF983 domain-containing protein [Acidobacteriota bacterium]|nr:DUF983 domain-containing protein [Acidobacteriota bacterium]